MSALVKSYKNLLPSAENQEFDHPELGQIILADISTEKITQLRNFFKKNYRDDYPLQNEQLFRWMFRHNYEKVSVLMQNERLLAHQGHIPLIYTNGDKDFWGFISASTIVDKDFRRKGLMSTLRGDVHSRYEVGASLGGSEQGFALYRSMNYQEIGKLDRYIAIVNPELCVKFSQGYKQFERTLHLQLPDSRLSILPVERFGPMALEIHHLWDSLFHKGKFMAVKRSAEYLDWRYSEHPIFEYHRWGCWKGKSLEGVFVFRIEHVAEAKCQVVRIVELFGRPEILGEFVNYVLKQKMSFETLAWIDWFCSDPRFMLPLKSLGFVPEQELLPLVIPIFCSPIDYYKKKYTLMFWVKDSQAFGDIPSIHHWYVTKGDGDSDRPNIDVAVSFQ